MLTVLNAFGVDVNQAQLEREIATDLGHHKQVVRTATHDRLFIGSLGRNWPAKDDLEQTLPKLNQINTRLNARYPHLTLGPYLRTPDNHYVVQHATYHYFLTPAFDGREADPVEDRLLLARTLGMFHQISMQEVRTPSGFGTRGMQDWAIPTLTTAEERGWSDVDGNLAEAINQLRWIRDYRADAVDALPTILIHGDFQAKNILINDHNGRVRIADAESGGWQPRLFDLYFLTLGNDEGVHLGNLPRFVESLAHYVDFAGPLSEDERWLLPNVIQLKAGGVAAWACEPQQAGLPDRIALLRQRYFQIALWCIRIIRDLRDLIRDAARKVAS